MPWSRSTSQYSQAAKALRRKWETEGPDNALFAACFRLQREASEAAGHYIPLIVENVRGAQEWVAEVFYSREWWLAADPAERWKRGRAAWNYGSYYLWGDVPALMPMPEKKAAKTSGGSWFRERNSAPQPGIPHEDRGMKAGHPEPERSY